MQKFDNNQCNLLKSFLDLKEICFFWEKNFLGDAFYNINQNQYNFLYYQSFYSSLRDIIDLAIFFVVNEEISNSIGRIGFENLLNQALKSESSKLKFYSSEQHFRDLKDLFVNYYNSMLGSMMLDFTVSSFSNFENWINYLFESSLCNKQKESVIRSRKNKVEKILIQESKTEKKIEKIMKLRVGDFFSLPDKLECVYKSIIDNNGSYRRDWKKDKEIIDFLAARRNAVHNQGIHKGKNKEIEINNKKFTLHERRAYHSNCWVDDILLFEELIKIYTGLLSAFPKEIRRNNINLFIITQWDEKSINILTLIISDYLNCTDISDESKIIMKNSLVNKFKLSENQSCKLIEELNNIDCDVWDVEKTLYLLSII